MSPRRRSPPQGPGVRAVSGARYLYPSVFSTRVRTRSTLSPLGLLVALTIADLRQAEHLKPEEPLTIGTGDLAVACHFARSSTKTVRGLVEEAVASGWIRKQKVARTKGEDGRWMKSRYWLLDGHTEGSGNPTADLWKTPHRGVSEPHGTEGLAHAGTEGFCNPNVVRSNYQGSSDTSRVAGKLVGDESPWGEATAPRPTVETPITGPALTHHLDALGIIRGDQLAARRARRATR